MRVGLEDRYEDDSRYVSVGATEDGRSRFDRWEKVAGGLRGWLADGWNEETFFRFRERLDEEEARKIISWAGRISKVMNCADRFRWATKNDCSRARFIVDANGSLFIWNFFFLRQWWNDEIAQVGKISFREFQIFTTQFSSESLIYQLWWCNNNTNLIDTETLIIYIYYNNIANFKERMLAVFSSRLIVKLIE